MIGASFINCVLSRCNNSSSDALSIGFLLSSPARRTAASFGCRKAATFWRGRQPAIVRCTRSADWARRCSARGANRFGSIRNSGSSGKRLIPLMESHESQHKTIKMTFVLLLIGSRQVVPKSFGHQRSVIRFPISKARIVA